MATKAAPQCHRWDSCDDCHWPPVRIAGWGGSLSSGYTWHIPFQSHSIPTMAQGWLLGTVLYSVRKYFFSVYKALSWELGI
jgi:hypothetical protein